MSDFDYTGKAVVVTGGATGVGAALLDLLHELGAADVTVLDIKQPSGPHKTFLETDLSDKAALERVIAILRDAPIDVLFNNAGVADTLPAPTVFRVNALAPLCLAEALLGSLSGGGAIVNTASIAGSQWPARREQILELLSISGWDSREAWFDGRDLGVDTYSFTKEVVQVFTMKFSHPAIAEGVRVNSVCPSPIDTPLLTDFRQTMSERVIDWTVQQCAGRLVTPREVASCLAWFGSPASSFVNGVNLNVDAGFSAGLTTGQLDFSGLAGPA